MPLTVFSFGAGVQSTALLTLMMKNIIPVPELTIFADTGNEPKSVYDHLYNVCKPICEKLGTKFIVSEFGNLGDLFIQHKDHVDESITYSPSIPLYTQSINKDKIIEGVLPRHCTRHAKIEIVNKAIKNHLGIESFVEFKDEVHLIIGISLDEMSRMAINKIKRINNHYPLIMKNGVNDKSIIWADKKYTRMDCLDLCAEFGITPPRSACYFCPYNSDPAWETMSINDVDAFESACVFDDRIRTLKEFPDQLNFVHKSRKPLREVVFQNSQNSGFDFNDECEGMCGL